jgi:acyl-CoA oxidase
MEQARRAATFDPIKLTHIIYDGYVDAILYSGYYLLIYGREENVSSRRAAFQRVESALELTDDMKLPHIYSGLDRNGLSLDCDIAHGRACGQCPWT